MTVRFHLYDGAGAGQPAGTRINLNEEKTEMTTEQAGHYGYDRTASYRPPQAVDTLATWGASPPNGRDPMTYAQPGPPPWTGQFQETKPKRKGHVLLWLAGALVLGFLLCGVGSLIAATGGAAPQPGFTTMPAQAPVAEQPSAGETAVTTRKVGQTFRSGDFEYTIHKVKTGLPSVGGEYLKEKAQGSFTRLDISVKNVSGKARYFDTDLRIKVEDAKGRQFSSSSAANVVGNDAAKGWFTEINPGNKIRAFAFFDLPSDAKATRVVVSAGLFDFEADAIVPLS